MYTFILQIDYVCDLVQLIILICTDYSQCSLSCHHPEVTETGSSVITNRGIVVTERWFWTHVTFRASAS